MAIYGCVLLMAAVAWYGLQRAIITQGESNALLATLLSSDWKGKLSPAIYLAAIPLAFVNTWIASGLFTLVALFWLIPDRRIERALEQREP
jgi:uncharacterized membrane protein